MQKGYGAAQYKANSVEMTALASYSQLENRYSHSMVVSDENWAHNTWLTRKSAELKLASFDWSTDRPSSRA
jgi:hypothetical protein